MDTPSRLMRSYTCMNLLMLVLSTLLPVLRSVATSSSILVAFAVTYVLLFTTVEVLVQYYQSLWFFVTLPTAVILHTAVHYLPLLFLDYTSQSNAAIVLFGGWYLIFRDVIPNVYMPSLSLATYDFVVMCSIFSFLILTTLFY